MIASNAARLSAEEIKDFYDKGYIVLRKLFSPDEVQALRDAFDRLRAIADQLKTTQMYGGSNFVLGKKDGRTVIHRINWCSALEPVIDSVGQDPRLLVPVSQILGSQDMNQLLSQAHFKEPHDGVIFPWHQDIIHRDKGGGTWTDVNGKGSYVQVLLAVDEMTEDNGPVLIIPGPTSSRIELGVHTEEEAYDSSQPMRKDVIDPSLAVPIVCEAGSVLLFGPYTVHGSDENRSDHPRRVLINGYSYPGANAREYPGKGAGRLLKAPRI